MNTVLHTTLNKDAGAQRHVYCLVYTFFALASIDRPATTHTIPYLLVRPKLAYYPNLHAFFCAQRSDAVISRTDHLAQGRVKVGFRVCVVVKVRCCGMGLRLGSDRWTENYTSQAGA